MLTACIFTLPFFVIWSFINRCAGRTHIAGIKKKRNVANRSLLIHFSRFPQHGLVGGLDTGAACYHHHLADADLSVHRLSPHCSRWHHGQESLRCVVGCRKIKCVDGLVFSCTTDIPSRFFPILPLALYHQDPSTHLAAQRTLLERFPPFPCRGR